MNPDYLPFLLYPIFQKEVDYCKGNRFHYMFSLGRMPLIRKIGNSFLSFLVKILSGYWNIVNPTNGYLAIKKRFGFFYY